MSSKTKARAWISEQRYLGVMGADNLDEMAAIIASHPDAYPVRDELQITCFTEVRDFLDTVTVEPVIVPVPVYLQERWDGSHMYSTEIDAKPGCGRVKVLGVHL